jgi:Tfp pilus assembly protein PilZ
MAETRAHPRFRTEVMLDFAIGDNRTAGMTWDISKRGMFVRTSRMPEVGSKLLITLRFPEGKQLLLQGEVVRTFTAPTRNRDDMPSGFGLTVNGGEIYSRFVDSVAAGVAPDLS